MRKEKISMGLFVFQRFIPQLNTQKGSKSGQEEPQAAMSLIFH